MNEDKKLKSAFSRIKEDINFLKKELRTLKSSNKENIKKEFEGFNSVIDDIRILVEENNKRVLSIKNFQEKPLNEINNKFESYKSHVKNIESKNKEIEKKVEDVSNNLRSFVDKRSEQLREDIESREKNMLDKIEKLEKQVENLVDKREVDSKVYETYDSLNEKISVDINSLRYEITEEISKIYDMIVDEDGYRREVKNNVKDNGSKDEDETRDGKSSPIKKVANWLFEDEEDLNVIKKEVKK